MKKFLNIMLEEIINLDLRQTAIVLPSSRASVFLREEFKNLNKTIILPDIYTMDVFAEKISGIGFEDELDLALNCFNIFSSHFSDSDFFEFLKIFSIILNDFNEIDMDLIDIKNLDTVKEIAKLEMVNEGSISKKYFKTMGVLKDIYIKINEQLEISKKGYRGRIYRIASKMAEYFNEYENIVFAGFNILTSSEKKIIDELVKNKNVKLFFNIPEILIEKNHESSLFIKQHIKRWENQSKVISCQNNESIKIYEYALPTDQTNSFIKEIDKNSCAVVLCDESLLIPAVKAVPSNIKKINITMGYPMTMTSMFFLYKSIMKLHINKNENGFYYKDVIEIIENIHVKSNLSDKFYRLRGKIKKQRKTYIDYKEDIKQDIEIEMLENIFSWYNENEELLSVDELLGSLRNVFEAAGRESEDSFAAQSNAVMFINAINRIYTLIKENPHIYKENNLQKLDMIITTIVSRNKIPFSGDPLEDFQIMGMLETRCLEFEKVLILSVNEGIMPKGKQYNTFIPYDCRINWGMLTYRNRDLLFSYYFYTLLLNCKDTVVVYSQSNNDYSEKSRFIEQLKWEKRKGGIFENKKIEIFSPQYEVMSLNSLNKIEKTNSIMNIMSDLSLSPSAISTFMNCPVDFFFKNVLKVKEHRDIEEMGMDVLGTAAHDVLNEIYDNNKGKILSRKIVDLDEKDIEKMVEKSFGKMGVKNIETGKPYLMTKTITRLIRNFIKMDIENNEGRIKIEDLEKHLIFKQDFNGKNIILNGIFDRIELLENEDTIRIMDYKSGSVEGNHITIQDEMNLIDIDDWIESDNDNYSKKLQLLFYGYLAKRNPEYSKYKIKMGIYSLRSPKSCFMLKYGSKVKDDKLKNTEIEYDENIDKIFENILKKIIENILNPDIPFEKKIQQNDYCVW